MHIHSTRRTQPYFDRKGALVLWRYCPGVYLTPYEDFQIRELQKGEWIIEHGRDYSDPVPNLADAKIALADWIRRENPDPKQAHDRLVERLALTPKGAPPPARKNPYLSQFGS